MKKFTKICSCLAAASIIASTFSPVAFAEGDANVIIGQKVTFESGNEPFIYEERTMMPLRAISEALDATVFWFSDRSGIQIVSYDTLLSLQIGNSLMAKYKIVNGEVVEDEKETIELEVVPMIHNDRTYVPLRAIAEAFDAKINWDNPTRSAIIVPSEKKTNDVTISEMTALPDSTLCAVYGVICKEPGTGLYYLRSLTESGIGAYSQIVFCTPTNTSISEETKYEDYVNQYWTEQFGVEDPSGMVVRYTGVTASINGVIRAALNKTTTGIKSLGYYDDYMRSLGIDYTPFENSNM